MSPKHNDQVHNPSHYTQGKVPLIDCIESAVVGYEGVDAFYAGNVIKYVARAPFKGTTRQDLEKAQVYLRWLLESFPDV